MKLCRRSAPRAMNRHATPLPRLTARGTAQETSRLLLLIEGLQALKFLDRSREIAEEAVTTAPAAGSGSPDSLRVSFEHEEDDGSPMARTDGDGGRCDEHADPTAPGVDLQAQEARLQGEIDALARQLAQAKYHPDTGARSLRIEGQERDIALKRLAQLQRSRQRQKAVHARIRAARERAARQSQDEEHLRMAAERARERFLGRARTPEEAARLAQAWDAETARRLAVDAVDELAAEVDRYLRVRE